MSVNVVMPQVGESVSSGVIAAWLKNLGDPVGKDEPIVSVETDKATVDVPSPAAGRLAQARFEAGSEVRIGDVLAVVEEGVSASATQEPNREHRAEPVGVNASVPAATSPAQPEGKRGPRPEPPLTPAVRRIAEERGLDLHAVTGTGPGGRILKGDVLASPAPSAPVAEGKAVPSPVAPIAPAAERAEEVVPMTPIRRRIGERLLEAQSNAAILTTFNEADMSRVIELRQEHQDAFVRKHGIKLGFMSFFVKACVDALREFPTVNAEIRGTDVVYKRYCDIGVAVGGGRGLVVPVIRDAERRSFAELERLIADYGARARENRLKLEELQGGTFTISNGGIYGSMLSTPILNPPQSGILGMHKIEKRAMVVDGQVVVRPMMYLALSYDHRLVDGREAVGFLVRVKECIEKPERLLFEL